MDKILDVMEDVKQNITDNQYIIIMDSLMKIRNEKEKEKEKEERDLKLAPSVVSRMGRQGSAPRGCERPLGVEPNASPWRESRG
jgi:hypothetical protein